MVERIIINQEVEKVYTGKCIQIFEVRYVQGNVKGLLSEFKLNYLQGKLVDILYYSEILRGSVRCRCRFFCGGYLFALILLLIYYLLAHKSGYLFYVVNIKLKTNYI